MTKLHYTHNVITYLWCFAGGLCKTIKYYAIIYPISQWLILMTVQP